jgi:hypothetical protein
MVSVDFLPSFPNRPPVSSLPSLCSACCSCLAHRFDKLLEAFEGWQFRLDIYDSSDDVA